MLRLSLIALLLMPGIAYAQKFLKVGEPDPGIIAARPSGAGTEGVTDVDPASGDAVVEDADTSPPAKPEAAAIELPDFVLPPESDGLSPGRDSDVYARVQTDGAGAPTLELATFGRREDADGAQSFLEQTARPAEFAPTLGLD